MRKIALTLCVVALTGCGAGQARVIGERLNEAEEVLCPLTTAQNIDRGIVRIMQLVPFFGTDWQQVCPDDA